MKLEYSIPYMEVIRFGKRNVITQSVTDSYVGDNSAPDYEGETEGWGDMSR